MPVIYFSRHGQTDANKKGVTRSWSDIPLNYSGQQAAKKIAKVLGDKQIKAVYSSDLRRSSDTAQHIAKASKVPHIKSKELRTLNLGNLSGKKVTAVKPMLDYFSNHPEKKIPSGESIKNFYNRSHGFLQGVLDGLKPNEAVAIVGHGRHMNAMNHLMKSLAGKQVTLGKLPVTGGPGPGSLLKLTINPSGITKQVLIHGEETKGVAS